MKIATALARRLHPDHESPASAAFFLRLLCLLAAAAFALTWLGCATPKRVTEVFRPDKLTAMDAAILSAISSNRCPGGVLWLEHNGTAYHRAFGRRALVPAPEPMTEDTLFDAASLTKVVACAPAVMRLIERGAIQLDAPVRDYLPEFTGGGKDDITVRHLLTHTSGLRPGIETRTGWRGRDEALRKACAETVQTLPGTAFKYSDINFIVLGALVQRVSRTPLEVFVQREIFAPLRMKDTGYLPDPKNLARIAPTEVEGDNPPLRGVVHDPTARQMGGVAGHAGLFTTAADLARFARMMLNLGELDGVRILQPGSVRLMTRVQTPPELTVQRGLGWDIDSPYSGPRGEKFPVGSYGHTGWTGGSLWIDPGSQTFVIFLSNRNHPTGAGNVIALRRELGTLAAESLIGFDFSRGKSP